MDPSLSINPFDDINSLLQFPFMQNAYLAATAAAILAGCVGWFVVARGQSLAAHALSQVGFPGATGAALIGAPPLAGLLIGCAGAAAAISLGSSGGVAQRRGESALVGTVLTAALALGFLFQSIAPGANVTGVYADLFGAILGISDSSVVTLYVVMGVALLTIAALGRPLLWASVDPVAAAANGVPVRLLSAGFLVVMAAAVASAALVTGTLLIFALLIAPAATAQRLSATPTVSLALSVGTGVGIAWLGLAFAYFSNITPGVFVTTLGVLAYVASGTTISRRRRHATVPAEASA